MVLIESGAQGKADPVHVIVTEEGIPLSQGKISDGDVLVIVERVAVHHLRQIDRLGQRHVSVIVHTRLRALAFLGRNEDYAVGAAGSVNGR